MNSNEKQHTIKENAVKWSIGSRKSCTTKQDKTKNTTTNATLNTNVDNITKEI